MYFYHIFKTKIFHHILKFIENGGLDNIVNFDT